MHKSKSVPLEARRCPEGSRELRFPVYVTMGQDGGKVLYIYIRVTWWRSWLRHCATNRKVASSIPGGVTRIFS